MSVVRGKGFSHTRKAEEALDILFSISKFIPKFEYIKTINALDRIIAENIISNINLPGFKRSAMDGYAVKANNTHGATETNPIQMNVTGMIEIGNTLSSPLKDKTMIKISTGAPLPEGADAVIKLEDCEQISDKMVEIVNSVAIGKNVAKIDEDIKKGEFIYNNGHLVKPWDIAMLIAIGKTSIKVMCKPMVATLSTGNELVDSDTKPKIGQVVDSNRPAINSWLIKLGVQIVDSQRCIDDIDIIEGTIKDLAIISDLIITTGGTSVGTLDFLPEIISKIGELSVHGLSIRPGKPLALGNIITETNGIVKETPIISLPGYPLAAFINFELFVSPLISKWTKIAPPWQKWKKVKLMQKIPSKSGFRDFIRLKKGKFGAELIRITGAGILSSLVKADYMLEIPEHIEGYAAGEEVSVKILKGD